MGSFSWYASDTHRAIRSSNPFPVYALRPDGEPLLETDYDGYGVFGGHDIYDLLADWNRKFLAEHPGFLIVQYGSYYDKETDTYTPASPKRVDEFQWYPVFSDLSLSRQEVEEKMQENTNNKYWEYRYIGIEIGCYDEQNRNLPYPIKLVEHPVPYAAAAASNMDPDQGFGENDRFEKLPSLNQQISSAQHRYSDPEQETTTPGISR